jgi:hypothetical protein
MPALTRRRPSASSRLPDVTSVVLGLRRIVRALELYSHDVRRTYGLTAPQLWALKTLAKTCPLTTGQLARVLLIHPLAALLCWWIGWSGADWSTGFGCRTTGGLCASSSPSGR